MASRSPTRRRPVVDPTIYPSEERVGEGGLQRYIVELFRPLLERFLAGRGERALVAADLFVYWRQFSPTDRIAPDVMVLPGVEPGLAVDSWKIWETAIRPSFALEVVSQDYLKDYCETRPAYDSVGAREVVVFDPDFEKVPGERARFQVFRRLPGRGLACVEATNADRVRSRALRCWLRAVGDGDRLRLRIATGPEGETIFPTAEEAERAARLRAEAEVARLRAELERLRPRRS